LSAPTAAGWTSFADLIARLQRLWDSGRVLKRYAAGEPWLPLSFPVRGPKADEVMDRLDEVNRWWERLRRECAGTTHRPALRIETKIIGGRRVGRNELPARVWVDSYEQFFGLVRVTASVRRLDALLAQTREQVPGLIEWAAAHPHRVLDHEGVWSRVLATVAWIARQSSPGLYVRQIDVAGVDTKFIEAYRLLFSDLLETVLPPERVDDRYPRSDFAGRFGFRRRPDYTRFRFLAPHPAALPGLSELALRTDELASLDLGLGHVVIVENEISYLALPDLPDTLAIFGSGFALGSVAGLSWLQDKRITYWGDIDTYGFVILNRLRARFPDVTSVLMDTETLLAHPLQWVQEDVPTNLALPHLSTDESALYGDLVEDRYGHHVRLEQERIRFSRVRRALRA
jgi:hypothetical protein